MHPGKYTHFLDPPLMAHLKEDAQRNDLVPIFGDFTQSEKLSEIKPPLLFRLGESISMKCFLNCPAI